MIVLKETAGDTLQGAIDGTNVTYVVSFDFYALSSVNIFVNGRLKIRDWDDGFSVVAPRTVTLKEALLAGDSLEVEYKSGIATGGGAEGGCPSKPQVMIMRPDTRSERNVPDLVANDLKPDVSSCGEDRPSILTEDMRPVILTVTEG